MLMSWLWVIHNKTTKMLYQMMPKVWYMMLGSTVMKPFWNICVQPCVDVENLEKVLYLISYLNVSWRIERKYQQLLTKRRKNDVKKNRNYFSLLFQQESIYPKNVLRIVIYRSDINSNQNCTRNLRNPQICF